MIVIPAINELDFDGVKDKIKKTEEFGAEWAHIDVADGRFTKNFFWNDPRRLRAERENFKVKIEIHLMIENPDELIDEWLDSGVERVIVHLESVKDVQGLKGKCEEKGVELVLAVNPDTPAEELFSYLNLNHFLILAVNPGVSGQKFQASQLEKIKALRSARPDVKIEVDGGVTGETAPKIIEAGADILVSASYIWSSGNPREAYERLCSYMTKN
jgi:ribulose-phosphate 3-epimerase